MISLAQPDNVTASGHHIWDPWAVEFETAELIYTLVRAAKPRLVVEAGTGRGYAATFICLALNNNGQDGRLVTFEPDVTYRRIAAENLADYPAELREGDSRGTSLKPDMVFVDNYGPDREPVIRYWLEEHDGDPLIVIHDAARPYPLHLGTGVFIPGHDGVWVGRRNHTH